MNLSWTHVHLIFNHFPIVGAIFGLLLLVYGMVRKSKDVKQASYWTFIIISLLSILVFYSGVEAAPVADSIPGVSGSLIHDHREIAEQSLIALGILGAVSLTGLFLFRGMRRTPTWFPAILLIVAIVSTGLVSWAGVRGGVLRHTEVHGDALDFLAPTDALEVGTPQQNLEIEADSTQQHSGAEAGITQQELGTEASSPPQDSGNGSGHFDDGHTHKD